MVKSIPVIFILSAVIISSCQNGEMRNKGNTLNANETAYFKDKGPFEVYARGETVPVEAVQGEDAADDPAIWFNRRRKEGSLVLGTNKKLGLDIYNLKGQREAFHPVGRVNNVDVRYDFAWHDTLVDIAAATNRSFNRIDIWLIHPATGTLQLVSDTLQKTNMGEVYGFCLYKNREDSTFYAFASNKKGLVVQWKLESTDHNVKLREVRRLQLRSQVEGMVADDEQNHIYIAEEEGGIFKFSALPEGSQKGTFVKYSDTTNPHLAYDIEGLTLYTLPDGKGYLLASSQGNNRFLVYDRQEENKYIGSFTIGDSLVDAVQETDGIAVTHLPLGSTYPLGLLVCQDGFNRENGLKAAQNFKFVAWPKIAQAFEKKLAMDSSYRSF